MSKAAMVHIAFIAGTYQPTQCGVAHYTARLRRSLTQQGIRSIVLTTHQAAESLADPTVFGTVKGWQVGDLLPLVRAIHQTRPEVLHIQHAAGTYRFNRAIFLLPLLLRATGWRSPIVTTVHEYGWWEWQPPLIPTGWIEWLKTWGQRRGWWDREDGFLLTQSQTIITTNHEAETILHQRLPQCSHHIYRIPIGANVEVAPLDRRRARTQVRQQYGWPDDTTIIAFFGFLHPVKGLETLLPAFQQIAARYPQARLLLVGGVESLALPGDEARCYWQLLQRQITDLGLNGLVQMTGYLEADEVSHQLMAADLGVLPFNHGVTLKSGSLLAMMAHSLPIVATQTQSPDPELTSGNLVKAIAPRQREALVNALDELLSNPAQAQQLASKAYQFSRQFAWSSIAETHVEIYQALTQLNLAPKPQSSLVSLG